MVRAQLNLRCLRVRRAGRVGFALLRPSHAHTAFTATLLLMASTFLSRIIGLVRVKYIAWQFGAGPNTDAYQAAFRLPDLMNYFLVGGAASITFVTILNRYRERGEEAEGERVLSIVINFIGLVLTGGVIAGMFLAPTYIRATNPGFAPWQVELSARMTRILLPGQIFFFIGGVLGATLLVRRQFLIQGITGIAYNVAIILGGMLLGHRMGIPSLAVGALAGAFLGPFAMNALGAARAGVRYRWGIDFSHPGLRDWVKMTLPLMAGFTLPFLDDYIVGYYASHGAGDITRLTNAKQLFSAPMAVLAQAAGAASLPFFARLWAQDKQLRVRDRRGGFGFACGGAGNPGFHGDGGDGGSAGADRLSGRAIHTARCAGDGGVLRNLHGGALRVVGTGNLCARISMQRASRGCPCWRGQ